MNEIIEKIQGESKAQATKDNYARRGALDVDYRAVIWLRSRKAQGIAVLIFACFGKILANNERRQTP